MLFNIVMNLKFLFCIYIYIDKRMYLRYIKSIKFKTNLKVQIFLISIQKNKNNYIMNTVNQNI